MKKKKRTNKKTNFNLITFLKENPGTIVMAIISIFIFLVVRRLANTTKGLIVSLIIFTIYLTPSIYRLYTGKKTTKAQKELFWKRTTIGIFGFCIVGFVAVIFFFTMIVIKAPNFEPNELYRADATVVYSSDGTLMAKLGAENRDRKSVV